MSQSKNRITIFEHDALRLGDRFGDAVFDAQKLAALQKFHGDRDFPFFKLINNGMRFCQFVGVIQVGKLTIEVLPKADKNAPADQEIWRKKLIWMLRAVGVFDIRQTSESRLKIKPDSILELYFEIFLAETEQILHRGLAKKYRKTECNSTSLKGSLVFSRHIQQNLVHQERFFVRQTAYDAEHVLHQILWKTLLLLRQINTTASLQSRISSLILNFPEMADLKISESMFAKITLNRKTEHYRKALEIAKLLLLNYHPDVARGQNHVLALMFDMNILWEKFVCTSLRKCLPDWSVRWQVSKLFWQSKTDGVRVRPDIFLEKDTVRIVLDAKWKNLDGLKPAVEDLRQMFVYHQYFEAQKTALVFPGQPAPPIFGEYQEIGKGKFCSLMAVPVLEKGQVRDWQMEIAKVIKSWID